jgi:hypothetical protein
MTDFRSLSVELLRSLENYPVQPPKDRDLCNRARAALAEQLATPLDMMSEAWMDNIEAETKLAPTDEELCKTYRVGYYAEKNRQGPHCMTAGLRAVLARWGQP